MLPVWLVPTFANVQFPLTGKWPEISAFLLLLQIVHRICGPAEPLIARAKGFAAKGGSLALLDLWQTIMHKLGLRHTARTSNGAPWGATPSAEWFEYGETLLEEVLEEEWNAMEVACYRIII